MEQPPRIDLDGALRASLSEIKQEYRISGGGLRHGSPEWHVSYDFEGLLRLLVFHLDELASQGVTMRVHVAATNGKGWWAQRDLGSWSMPASLAGEVLSRPLRPLVEQTVLVANSLSKRDLRPLRIGWGNDEAN